MTDTTEPLAYGVWIPGKGWLKFGARPFADTRPEMAETARAMYDQGLGTGARVELIDQAMIDLEGLWQEREALGRETINQRKERRLYRRFMRWVHGLL